MTCYDNGKIYLIRNYVNEMVYVGSTCSELYKRFYQHKNVLNYKNKRNRPLYRDMFNIGVDKFYIELFEEYKCENKMQLNKREGEIIRSFKSSGNCYNLHIAGATQGITQNEYQKINNEEHKSEIQKRQKEYYNKKRIEILEYRKEQEEYRAEYYKQKNN